MSSRPAVLSASLLAALTVTLAACGSDSGGSGGSGGGAGAGGTSAVQEAAGGGGGGGGGGDITGPCDLTDQATVASVFPGIGAGKPGSIRNCEFTGSNLKVNIFYFEDLTLAELKKQDQANDVTFTPIQVGDQAIKDQLHTVSVQQGDVLFAVQALGSSVQEAELAKYDRQILALATKIAADL